jgi:hypothetical protein
VPKHVGVENLERIGKKSTTTLRICWFYCKRYYKMLGTTTKIMRMRILIELININFGFIKKREHFLVGETIIGLPRYKSSIFILASYHVSLPAGSRVALANL